VTALRPGRALATLVVASTCAWPAATGAEPLGAVPSRLEALVGVAAGQGRYVVDWAEPVDEGAELAGLRYDPRERTVTGSIGGGRSSRPVTGRVRLLATVPTPVRAIAQGEIVAAADLGAMDVDLLTVHRETVAEEALVLDRAARRRLEAGRPILARDLRTVPAVQRNEIVTIMAATGHVAVRAKAKALDAGSVGQAVRVQNVDSRKVTTGTVVGRGLVDVRAGQP
jgi:flagella basal body P-ring formation protein FlgA